MRKEYVASYGEIIKEMDTSPFFPREPDKEEIKECLDINDSYGLDIETVLGWACFNYRYESKGTTKAFNNSEIVKKIKHCYELKREFFRLGRLIDIEREFCGDIIITDPCYLMKKVDWSSSPQWSDFHPYKSMREYPDYNEDTDSSEMYKFNSEKYNAAMEKWKNEHVDDWEKCDYGENMDALDIHNYLCRDTLYGDWTCTAFDSDSGKKIGSFCADAGLVGVFLLDEVLKYNPDFDYKHWSVTWIKDFKGNVELKVVHTTGVYEENGKTWEDDSVEVHGHGVNTVTGKPINFVGCQTGL